MNFSDETIVFALYFVGQLEQPIEHDRHHVNVCHAFPLDHSQQIFCIETRFEDHIGAEPRGREPIGVGRRVIHGSHDRGNHVARLVEIIGKAEAAA